MKEKTQILLVKMLFVSCMSVFVYFMTTMICYNIIHIDTPREDMVAMFQTDPVQYYKDLTNPRNITNVFK